MWEEGKPAVSVSVMVVLLVDGWNGNEIYVWVIFSSPFLGSTVEGKGLFLLFGNPVGKEL